MCSGWAILPTFLWHGEKDIWGDGTDWWLRLGANKAALIVGACFSFIMVWIVRVLVVWRALKAIQIVRKRTTRERHSYLNI